MADISNQFIKDSFDYVLQSDLVTGIVFRIGGSIPNNPIFQQGLSVNSSFTYSDGSEFTGFVLTCDAFGNATWGPVSGATSGVVITGGTFNYNTGTLVLINSSGTPVTITGLTDTYITGGTISGTSVLFTYNDGDTFFLTGITPFNVFSSYTATTQPLILNSVTGGSYSNGTLNLVNNSGVTIPITGFTTGDTSGLSYYVSVNTPTGTAFTSGDRWFNTNTGIELVYIDDGDSSQFIQPFSVPGPISDLYYQTTGITSSQTITWDKTYWGISANTNVDLTLPSTTNREGYFLIIKDESGTSNIYRIRLTPTSGTIDGNNFFDMNINYMSLTCMVRGGNWYLINLSYF